MEQMLQDMKTLYANRRLSGIDGFMEKWIAPECVVMGTALGEIALSTQDVRDIFDSDLRYWYDLAIDADHVHCETIGEMVYLSCGAEISYTICENAKRYDAYAKWCAEIAQDAVASPAAKGAQIAFILDTLLSSRKNKRRRNCLPLTIHVLLAQGKAALIAFAFDLTIDTADHYLGDGADTEARYAEERRRIGGSSLHKVVKHVGGLGYLDTVFGSRGNVFFGTALQMRRETLDEAMATALAEDRSEDTCQALFDLRLRIAYLQKVYALESHPKAIIRFFGIMQEGVVKLFVPMFPLCSYLERR